MLVQRLLKDTLHLRPPTKVQKACLQQLSMKKSAAGGALGAQPILHKFSNLGKQILLHVSWLLLFHITVFYLAPPSQKEFTFAISRSINDALPNGITSPADVYVLLQQLQVLLDNAGPMASSPPIAGGILLRQMRVVSRKCSTELASITLTACAPPYTELDEEQEFKPWLAPPLSPEVLRLPEFGWQSAVSSGDIGTQGLPASGFTLRLASANATAAAIERLKKNAWIDAKTRALYATCCFYNGNAKIIACTRTAVIVGPTGLYASRHSLFDFEIDRINVTTARGISVFIAQALLFAVTIMLLMQESIKMILHSVSAYVRDVTNIRRAAAYVLYIASGMLAFYRETGIERAKTATDPIPILVSISDSSIMGLYAQAVAALFMWLEVIHFLRISNVFSRIVGAIWDIFVEIVAICFLVLILVVAFATCLTVSMGQSDPLFTSFGTSAETLLRLLFGDSLPYSSFYNTSSPLEESSRFKLMLYVLWKLFASVIILNMVLSIVIKSYFATVGFAIGKGGDGDGGVSSLMQEVDANDFQDGVIDTQEFKQLMESKFGANADIDVQATFKKFDVNNDGVLDEEEMIAVKKELEDASMKGFAVKGDGGGVRSEVLEAQMERIETFVVAVHGSCNTLHEEAMQNSAGIKAVVKELQSLNASIQQLQARVMKMAGGKSDESGVKSKMRARVGQAAKNSVNDEEASP